MTPRRLRALLAGRRGALFKLGLGGAALLFCLSIAASGLHLTTQSELEARVQRTSVWTASQMLVELSEFEAVLRGVQLGTESPARMWQQFEILYSRMKSIDPPDDRIPQDEMDRLRDQAPLLMAELDEIERDLQAMLAGSVAAGGRVDRRLAEMKLLLRHANVRIHQQRNALAQQALANLGTGQTVFLACTLGLMVSAGLLILLLLAESARARWLLAQSRAAAEQLSQAEGTLRILIDNLPALICATDAAGRCLFVNEAYAGFHGLEPGRVGPDLCDGPQAGLLLRALAAEGPLPFVEGAAIDHRGRSRTLLSTAVSVAGAGGERRRVVFIAFDITHRKAAENRIRHLAEHDPLTDLPNRTLFKTRLRAALAPVDGERGGEGMGAFRPFALHSIDLDGFKAVNDSHGHPVGDELLLAVAARMAACLAPEDMLARIGGDEFAVIQARVAGAAEALALSGRLIAAAQEPFHIGGLPIRIGASIGTVLAPGQGRRDETLLRRSDMALYEAKAAGRGQAVLFRPEMEEAVLDERLLTSEVVAALRQEALFLVFQPKYRIGGAEPIGCEALLRWNHPVRGAVPPGRFVPLAEAAGHAAALARHVLRHACRQAAAWRREGQEMPVAVNLSASLFATTEAVELVREALAESGLPHRLLEVELTESIFIRDAERARETLAGLRALGVRVALDDFGTGYAALGYLQSLRFDTLKIDRVFIQALGSGRPDSTAIVAAILALARALGAEAVAEGVETEAQLAALAALGCDAVQGYLLGRPMPAPALAARFRAAALRP